MPLQETSQEKLRDSKGRFIKADFTLAAMNKAEQTFRDAMLNPGLQPKKVEWSDESPLKISPVVRAAVWLSHNRWSIVGYIAYVILCGCAGAIGAVLGLRLG